MRFTRRSAAAAAAAAAIALTVGLAGCGAESNTGGGTASYEPGTAGTLTLVSSTAPNSVNPLLVGFGNAATQTVDLAYGSFFDWRGGDDYEPLLAESFKWLDSANMVFEIKLREDVLFSDGEKLNAEAEKTFLEYFMGANAQGSAVVKSLVSKIVIPDEYTIDIYLNSSYPDAQMLFSDGGAWGSPISPAAIANQTDQLGYATFGAGPYMLDSAQTISGSKYVYVPNPNYFDPSHQPWTQVEFTVIANTNSALETVKAAEHGIMAGTTELTAAANAAGLTVDSSGADLTYMIMLTDRSGTLTPAMGNQKVRQALNYAIDRDAIATLLGGVPNDQIASSDTIGVCPQDTYTFDQAKAKQLLSEAGYASGLTLSLLVPGYEPSIVNVAQAVADQYSKVGVTIELNTAPNYANFLEQQKALTDNGDIERWTTTTLFKASSQLIVPNGFVNPRHDSDDELNELNELITAASSVSGDKAVAAWEEFSCTLNEKAWFVPMATIGQDFYAKNVTIPVNGLYPNPIFMDPTS